MAGSASWEGSLPVFLSRHFHHHARFDLALALGLAAFALAQVLAWPVPAAIGADTFFTVFLLAHWWLVLTLTSDALEKKSDVEDEGAALVTLITLGAVAYAAIGVFALLAAKQTAQSLALGLTLAGAPLGWFMLHTLMAFHYAHLHYRGDDRKDYVPPLKFPACGEPGPWDFIYFAFVVGMTAQVSDTLVQTTAMRRAVMAHSIVSFFFNTVLIAMAVNAAVTLAS